ncbi:MAG: cation-transporting P-type ATPase, partial [Halobacteriales archaeon]|nr:cation-transporting P-type ATPase [Halobacteriales archaeon]
MLRIRYDPAQVQADQLPDAVSGYGYRARPVTDADTSGDETPWRLIVGGFFGMMVMMWYFLFLYPAYAGLVPTTEAAWGQTGRVSLINVWIATTAVLAVTGYPILRGAYVSLRSGVPNMDLLISLAVLGAYTYSATAAVLGEVEVYFDVVVVILLTVSVGRYYEGRVKRRATGRLEELAKGRVTEAKRRTATGWETVPLHALERGDTVLVRPGERVPVDGTITEGTAAVDESVITGESLPVDRGPGDEVIAGAVVTDAPLEITVGDPTARTVDRILSRLWDLQSARRGAGQLADRLAAVFVPLVILLALSGMVLHLWTGTPVDRALLAGLAVLVV